MTRKTVIACMCLALLGTASMAVGFPQMAQASPVVGNWNIQAGNPSWLSIEPADGKFMGRFLGGAGSVGGIGEVKVDGAKVEFKAHGWTWTGTVTGDEIKGTRVKDDNKDEKGEWTGKRSVRKPDLAGQWALRVTGNPAEHLPILTLKQEGLAVSGELKQGDKVMKVTDAQLTGNLLSFSIEVDGAKRRYGAQIQGDRIEGIISNGQGRRGMKRFVAYRQRQWGDPIELFNGKDLSNWEPLHNVKNYQWKVIDGIMTNTGGGGSANIVSKDKFRDFRAHIEFKVPKNGNSGVYLRGRHEIQVADTYGQGLSWHMCGALYSRLAPNVNAAKKAGEWQTYDITLVGYYVTVVHNGQVILDNEEIEGITGGMIDCNEDQPGPIYLQGDHGAIEYRKITIWPAK